MTFSVWNARWLFAATALGFATVSAQAQTAQPSGTITIVGFSGLFTDNYTALVIKPFMAKYPNVKVNFRPVLNSGEAQALLRVQKDKPSVDVVIMDISVSIAANKEGLFAPLDPAQVPSLADIPDWGKPDGNMGAAMSQDNLSIVYNPKQVSPAPTSWNDLLKPDYAGRLGITIADTRGVLLAPVLDRMLGADYKQTIEPALDWMKKLAPNVQTWAPVPEVYTAVQSGQIAMGLGWNGRAQYLHDQTPNDIAVTVPAEGSATQINTINLVAKSPNAAAAQAFINYSLSEEAQKAFAEKSFYGPVNSKVKLDPAIAQRITGGPAVEAKTMHLDWSWLTDRYPAWVQRIKREVIGG